MFPFTHYQKAESLAHALSLLQADPGARPLAGGTDVLLRLRDGHAGFERLVDIRELPELSGILFDQAQVWILRERLLHLSERCGIPLEPGLSWTTIPTRVVLVS